MIDPAFVMHLLDSIFLQGDMFGLHGGGPLGSDDPMIKGIIPSAFAMIGFAIL